MASARSPLIAALIIAAAAALAYHNTFSVPFLFDDNSSIRDNPTIRSLGTAWSPPNEHGLTVSGRPMLNFTLALNYAISGAEVWSYHVMNLLIHVLAGCVLFGVVRRTLTMPLLAPRFGSDAWWLALATALLWVLHPLQTESVTYVVQRAESLVALFYLLTLWCFIRATESDSRHRARWTMLAFVSCALGMASKEVMATAPIVIALYDRVFVAGSWSAVWRRHQRLHLLFAATWLLLGLLVIATGNRGGTAGIGTAISSKDYALMQIGAVMHYLRLAIWPSPLVFDYGRPIVDSFRAVLGPALLLFPLMLVSAVAAWRGKPAGFCGLFFFGVLAPTSSFIPVVTQTMNEHRVYLPLAAVIALIVVTAYGWLGRKALGGYALVAIILCVLTIQRNRDYRTELAIWQDTVAKCPTNDRAFAALGAIQQRENRLPEALAALQEAARLAPTSAEIINNLGNVWMKLGQWAEAQRCFEQALQLKPNDAFQLNNLGNALLQQNRIREAMAQFEAALRVKPELHEARYNLANILAQNGRFTEAAPHYAALLAAQPDDAEAHSNYGNVLLALNRSDEGIAELVKAAALRPNDAQIHNNLGVAFAQNGRFAEAVREFETAVRLQPDFAEARENDVRARRALTGN